MRRSVRYLAAICTAAAFCMATGTPVPAEWTAPIDAPAEPPPKVSPSFEVPLRDVDRFILPARFTGMLAMASDNKSGTVVVDLRRVGQERVRLVKGEVDAESAMLSDNGLSIITAHRDGIERRSLETNMIERTIPLEEADEVRVLAPLPNNLVAVGIERDNQTTLEIYDLQTMKRTFELPLRREASLQVSVSPTGKLLAVADGQAARLIDPAGAKALGESALPGAAAVAFSPNGEEIAVLVGGEERSSRLVVLSAADGKTVKTLDLSRRYPKQAQREGDFREYMGYGEQQYGLSPAIQWMPEGDGWLLGGCDFVDRESGKVFYTLDNARPTEPVLLIGRERVVKGATLTVERGGFVGVSGYAYKAVAVPKEEFDAMRAAVRAGHEPGDAKLPPMTPAKWTAVKNVEPPAKATPWSLSPDPAPPAKPGVGDFSAVLPPHSNVAAVGMAPSETGVALALTWGMMQHRSPQPGDPRELDVLRIDLTNGASRSVGKVQVDEKATFRGLSVAVTPDADHVLIKTARPNGDRLDYWALAGGGKHVAGWRPDNEAGEPARIIWMAALDGANVITASERGDIVRWSLPACEVVWIARTSPGSLPALSGGRRYLALGTDSGPLIIDTRTGAVLAKVDLKPPRPEEAAGLDIAAFRVAFDPQGQRLEALGVADGGPGIVAFNLADGARTPPIVLPGVRSWDWLDERRALVNHCEIYDTRLRARVWVFTRPPPNRFEGRFDPVSAGRYWMIVSNQAAPTLCPFPLLSDAIREAIDTLDPATVGVIMSKGDRVAVSGETGDPALDKLWIAEATERLRTAGVSIDPDARLRLVCTRTTEVGGPETYQTRRRGQASTAQETVQGRTIKFDLHARLGPQTLYSISETVGMPYEMIIPENSSVEAAIAEHLVSRSPVTVQRLAEKIPAVMVSGKLAGQSLFPVPPEVLAAARLIQEADGTWNYVTQQTGSGPIAAPPLVSEANERAELKTLSPMRDTLKQLAENAAAVKQLAGTADADIKQFQDALRDLSRLAGELPSKPAEAGVYASSLESLRKAANEAAAQYQAALRARRAREAGNRTANPAQFAHKANAALRTVEAQTQKLTDRLNALSAKYPAPPATQPATPNP
jgi:hypothetical protein